MGGGEKVKDSVLNKYCWISSTFTLPRHFEVIRETSHSQELERPVQGELKEDFIHYGVGPEIEDDEKRHHQYYQWVPLVLSLQVSPQQPDRQH